MPDLTLHLKITHVPTVPSRSSNAETLLSHSFVHSLSGTVGHEKRNNSEIEIENEWPLTLEGSFLCSLFHSLAEAEVRWRDRDG